MIYLYRTIVNQPLNSDQKRIRKSSCEKTQPHHYQPKSREERGKQILKGGAKRMLRIATVRNKNKYMKRTSQIVFRNENLRGNCPGTVNSETFVTGV